MMRKSAIRKTLVAGALAAGAAVAVMPAANADPVTDPAHYSLHNGDFVVYTDFPAALQAQKNGKQVIVTPYGTSKPIACHDNTAPLDDCWQRDDFGWYRLQKQQYPQIGTVWVHLT
ncbi:MAG: hypothetical protein J2P18_01990 [Nocardia sp.]|nr:hypothetical protein [Nocardia sp.]